MEAMTRPRAREWPPEGSPCETIQARYRKPMEVMTKPCAREWPPKGSPRETTLETGDEALGRNHHTQEWDSKAVRDVTMVKGDHQDKEENNTDIKPSEELTKETIASKAPNEHVTGLENARRL